MEVTYGMRTQRDRKKFERDFRHLFYRLQQLDDHIVFYFIRGRVHGIVYPTFNRAGIPFIERATFGREEAERYEKTMDAYFSLSPRKCKTPLPLPKFDVTLRINYGGGNVETHVFPYSTYSEEALLGFCSTIERNAHILWEAYQKGGNL